MPSPPTPARLETPPQPGPQGRGERWAEKHVYIAGETGCVDMGVEERGVITVKRAVDDWCHCNMNELTVTPGRLN